MMKAVKFSQIGKRVFLISWIAGTIILLLFLITKSWFFVWLGFYYLVIAIIVNIIAFFCELLAYVTDIANKKSHGNSALLILSNIPIAVLYFLIFINI